MRKFLIAAGCVFITANGIVGLSGWPDDLAGWGRLVRHMAIESWHVATAMLVIASSSVWWPATVRQVGHLRQRIVVRKFRRRVSSATVTRGAAMESDVWISRDDAEALTRKSMLVRYLASEMRPIFHVPQLTRPDVSKREALTHATLTKFAREVPTGVKDGDYDVVKLSGWLDRRLEEKVGL